MTFANDGRAKEGSITNGPSFLLAAVIIGNGPLSVLDLETCRRIARAASEGTTETDKLP